MLGLRIVFGLLFIGLMLSVWGCAEDAPAAGFALHRAATEGNVEEVRQLLSAGVDPNAGPYKAGGTALAAAAARNRDIVALLLAAGADPNLVSDQGYTPLIAAASVGAERIVADLIEAGADIDAADVEYNVTALHTASRRGDRAVVQRLLDSGADPFIRSSGGSTPRDLARLHGHRRIEALLLEAEQRRAR